MKKRYILFIILIITIICIIYIFSTSNKKKMSENKEGPSKQNIEEKKEDSSSEQKIENIKEELGYNSTDTEMYEIKTEYDGREVLRIKPNIQYKVAMAGAIKNERPEFSEVDKLLEQAPNQSGIWITEKSREKFLNILKEITKGDYTIDNKGFLNQVIKDNSNEIDNKIKKIINEKKLYAIDINNIAYLVDEVTGNIEEYPFEEIDPESPYELFETENTTLYVITPNTYKKLDYKYVIEEVLNNMNN